MIPSYQIHCISISERKGPYGYISGHDGPRANENLDDFQGLATLYLHMCVGIQACDDPYVSMGPGPSGDHALLQGEGFGGHVWG
jgi:hypothetical protein